MATCSGEAGFSGNIPSTTSCLLDVLLLLPARRADLGLVS
ncbi:hypothetical protein SCE1572_31675 [Sorangium cellulosum So0157-2]|uniref:Uncharacterized protein n=1 Tax=Sorangium cellulosum So0157-2 TaxID=1254432 RepID=S4Y370_SORCE|nr:hypothetical protein SCE1572_31675 [Sorangium cellulosum So0157-2]